jgi:prepilin-type N-terminal cleavage/methylation domain-containing protein
VVRKTRGFTLLEVLVAAGILGSVLGAAFGMFSAGNRSAVKGMSSVGLLSSALLLEQNLTHDLQQVMMPTSAPAVVLDLSGTYLSFYVPDRKSMLPVFGSSRKSAATTATWITTGAEVRYHLVNGPDDTFQPTRGEHVFRDVYVKTWRFRTSSSTPPTTGTSAEVDATPHPLPPELRKRLALPPVKPRAEASSAPASPSTSSSGTTTGSPSAPAAQVATATATYLLCEYTLVDRERRTELKRSFVVDLVNVRSKATYGALYRLPPGVIAYPARRAVPDDVLPTFEPAWEKEKSR